MAGALVLMLAGGCASPGGVGQKEIDVSVDDPDTDGLTAFVYFLHPTREGFSENPTDEEVSRVQEHFQYLKTLTAQGVVLLAGPSTDPPFTGIVVFKAANREAAQRIMDGDPAVQAGVFEARLSAFRMSLVGDLK